jgi:hypothetical protein
MNWADHAAALEALAARQIFFVGGAPRSGTTWLQLLLDQHPEICCKGEGLFQRELATPLEQLVAARRKALAEKNDELFQQSGGFPLPDRQDTLHLFATGVMLGLERQCAGVSYHAVGEKTPENVFLFPVLKLCFPRAKFIGIVRDPRDTLASAWHLFQQKAAAGKDQREAKLNFLKNALPGINSGLERMVALRQQYGADCFLISYEGMKTGTANIVTRMFQHLGVASDPKLVAACIEATAFARLSGGRKPGEADDTSFFRKGVVGDWPSAFTPEMAEVIMDALGRYFPAFGWKA